MMKSTFIILLSLSAILWGCKAQKGASKGETATWEFLLDDQLSKWDIFMGVPHYSVELEGYEKGDGRKGTPIGLNKDPLNVFTTSKEGDEIILNVSGEVYAGLSTKKEYENYHLSFETRWGTKKYEPRLQDLRDSGVLYHAKEPHGQFWNVWMRAPEMQVQETDCGDFFPLAGVGMDIRASTVTENGKDIWIYDPKGEMRHIKSGPGGRCKRSVNLEKSNGQWNLLELICIGDKAYHIVNGKVVMVLENSVTIHKDAAPTSLTKGKIQFQSEAAEVYYKNIKIRKATSLPETIAKQLL